MKRSGDSLDFEAVYLAQLPKPTLTEAHKRLDKIREQLVAAKANIPVLFPPVRQQGAAASQAAQPANPYAISYFSAPGQQADPAQANAAAVEAEIARQAAPTPQVDTRA